MRGSLPNLFHVKCILDSLNSIDTTKSPISWWKGGRTKGWYDKYLENPAGSRPTREIKEGKMPIKEEEGTTERGFRNILKERLKEEQERENYNRIGKIEVFSF